MDAHRTTAQLDTLTGGLLMSMMISAERGAQNARARQRQAQEIVAHNQAVARILAARRRRAAVTAAQVAGGEARMSRWLDRVAN